MAYHKSLFHRKAVHCYDFAFKRTPFTGKSYTNGKRQPSLETLDILASFYQISVDYLIGRTDFPAPAKPLTTEEEQILQQYRTLDARGKQVLAALAALESTYSKSTE